MVNDPIADFLVRLQNASRVGHARVSLPHSKMKEAIAKLLEKEGYLSDIEKHKKGAPLSVTISYKEGTPVMRGFKRISKPSRRMYMGVRDLRPVMRGYGLLVLSTPAGIMTGKEAREKRLGGEALFEIW